MTDVINPQTGLVENLSEGERNRAFVSGSLTVRDPSSVSVISPNDGETYEVDEAKAKALIAEGGWTLETPHKEAIRLFKEEQESNPLTSFVSTAAKQAVNQLALGIPSAISREQPEDNSRELNWNEKLDIQSELNPVANIAGGTLGIGGTLVAGGPLFKAASFAGEAAAGTTGQILKTLGPSAAAKFASTAASLTARGIAEGAVMAAPQAVAEAALGDHETVGEALLAGLHVEGIGALAGGVASPAIAGVGSLLSSATKAVASRMDPEKLRELSDTIWFRGKDFKSELGKVAKIERNLAKSEQSPAVAKKMTQRELVSEGKSSLEEFGVNAADDILETEKKLLDYQAKLGPKLNTLYNSADEALLKQNKSGIISGQEMLPILDEVVAKHTTAEGLANGSHAAAITARDIAKEAFARKVLGDDRMNILSSLSKGIEPTEAQASSWVNLFPIEVITTAAQLGPKRLKGYAQELIDTAAKKSVLGVNESFAVKKALPYADAVPGSKEAWHTWSDAFFTKIDALAPTTKNPTLTKSLKEINAQYRRLQAYLAPGGPIDSAVRRVNGRNAVSLTDTMAGLGGAVISGNPVGGLVAVGANMARREYGDRILSASLNKIADVMASVQTNSYQSINKALGLVKAGTEKARVLSPTAISRYFPEDDSSKRKSEQLVRLSKDLSTFQVDARAQGDAISQLIAPISQDAPVTSQMLASKMSNALAYLNSEMPKPTNVDPLNFRSSWVPSDREISQFERKMQAVLDPMSVLDEIQAGTLTKEHVHALENVYPKLLSHLRTVLVERLKLVKQPLSPKVKYAIRLFMNQPDFNLSPDAIVGLQLNFEPKEAPGPQANSKITQASRVSSDFSRVNNDAAP